MLRAYFPDAKSAALACEQMSAAGFELNLFRLEVSPEPDDRPQKTQPPLQDRLIALLWHRQKQAEQKAEISEPDEAANFGRRPETVVWIEMEKVHPVIAAIVVQHNGYLEVPMPQAPASPGGRP